MIRRFLRARRGTSALEFALLAPAFVLFLLGAEEYARVSWVRQALQSVAVSGARCIGVLDSNCASGGAYSASTAQSYIIAEAAKLGVTLISSEMTLTNAATCGSVSGFSQVSITYTFSTVLPQLLPELVSNPTLTAASCYPNTH